MRASEYHTVCRGERQVKEEEIKRNYKTKSMRRKSVFGCRKIFFFFLKSRSRNLFFKKKNKFSREIYAKSLVSGGSSVVHVEDERNRVNNGEKGISRKVCVARGTKKKPLYIWANDNCNSNENRQEG